MALTVSWVQTAVKNECGEQVSGLRNTKPSSAAPLLEVTVTDDPGLGVFSRGFVLSQEVGLQEAE